MFTNSSSSEDETTLGSLLIPFTNNPILLNTENRAKEDNSNLSRITTESPFLSADLLEQNWWNVFDQRYFRHSTEWTVILIVAYMLILVVGVIGNSMVILVVVLRPQMRTVTNMFIMNLAVADLFVIVFCAPATLLSNIFQRKSPRKNKLIEKSNNANKSDSKSIQFVFIIIIFTFYI